MVLTQWEVVSFLETQRIVDLAPEGDPSATLLIGCSHRVGWASCWVRASSLIHGHSHDRRGLKESVVLE